MRIDLAFDTQKTWVVVAPEDALEGWFVGVSLLMIRRARMGHFGEMDGKALVLTSLM